MYRLAEKQDLPGILALWQEAFHETPILPECTSFVAECDGQVAAMVHALPQLLRAQTDCKAAYLYAIATKKEYRGRGLCRGLMAYAERMLDADCCVLVPAEERLFSFYESLGYKTAFFRSRTQGEAAAELSMAEYLRRREALLRHTPHMVYEDLSYAQRLYGLKFYETKEGITAKSLTYTAETLPGDQGGAPYGMIKWLRGERPMEKAYLGFSLE